MKNRAFSPSVILMGLCLTSVAWAFNAGGQRGVVRAKSAHTLGIGGIHLGLGGKYDRDNDYVMGPGGTSAIGGFSGSPESPQIISSNVYFAVGPARHLDVSLAMPFYFDLTGFDETAYAQGDLEIAMKLKFPFLTHNALLLHSYYLAVTAPTGNKEKGFFPRNSYHVRAETPVDELYTAGGATVSPRMLWTLDFTSVGPGGTGIPLLVHLNLGAIVTTDVKDNMIVGNLAIEYTPVEFLTLFAELSAESDLESFRQEYSPRHLRADPIWITPGAKLNLPADFYIYGAGDFGLSSREDTYRTNWSREGYSYSTGVLPLWGAQIGIGWSLPGIPPDSDADGVPDKDDPCPLEAEDKDNFEDDDGCPDRDNDKDGVPDFKDKCPDEQVICDGCPPKDKDEDGIVDDKDKCPQLAEDMDGFEDQDGCPENDNDHDEIPDVHDKCPDKKEDFDRFQDDDGCPDDDNDGDGVMDEWDQCPNTAGVKEAKGCPKAKEIQRGRLILKGVHFESGKATLTPNSFMILNEVFESLKAWPEVKIEIRGYTDSIGSATLNQKLSQARAESVMEYIVGKGIDRSRIRAIGMGEADPIASNQTAQGRAKNRRVEIHRTD
ncbi:MAG: OmpA family protein [Chitinivibrionales bacterium]|nr:OmpA family protein [Chitinivibrionales bacterium]MBD3395188.1 OmpA family protein [Chitinivibrionales bacterium]